tara:strand:+ start:208 stop:648 length:441 start_codon:yes stop_codon:yes gene_type:complete
MSCSCYECWGGDDCQVETEVVQTDVETDDVETYDDDFDDTPRCSGYITWITKYECNNALDRDEERRGICDSCVSKRDHQLQVEDDAAEDAHQRQLNMEEFQGMEGHGDFDGDDRDRKGQAPVGYLARLSDEILSKQLHEDKKKRNF